MTWLLALLHIVWIVGVMWVGVFLLPQRLRYLWVILMLVQMYHWTFSSGECVLSYLEKKAEDPSYKLGENPELTYAWVILGRLTGASMLTLRKVHAVVTQAVFIFALADIILVHNQLRLGDAARTVAFIACLVPTLELVSFDSFDRIAAAESFSGYVRT